MTLAHLVLLVAHDRRAVHVLRDLPAEAFVEKVVLGSRREVLAAADDMRDAHQVVVDNIGKVIGGKAVPLQKDLVVERIVGDRDVSERSVVEGRRSLKRDLLADDVRLARFRPLQGLRRIQRTAGILVLFKSGLGVRTVGSLFLFCCLVAEAVVSVALFDQHLRILLIGTAALGLDIRSDRSADVRTFVVLQSALLQRPVDHLCGALDLAALVRVFKTENEISSRLLCDQVGI